MSSALSISTSNQATALALGLGPRFNWLENKINTMQTCTQTKTAKLRPLLPKLSPVEVSLSSVDQSSGDGGGVAQPSMSAAALVGAAATTTTATTTTTTSSPQPSAPALSRNDVITTQAPDHVR